MEQDLSYSYSSKPRPVQTNRGKTRDGGNKAVPTNIMHDPRIPRGSVFAPVNTSRSSEGREKAKKRRNTANKRRSNNNRNHVNAFKTMAGPSNGFTSISLASNLIEQTQPTSERESFSQTDEFLSRTVNARNAKTNDIFIRPKIGIDTFTQIEESDGLFNFDVEVKPLLNVLVNKTLAQALLEVKEEQEMQILHCQHEVLKAEKSDARQEERELEEKAKEANRRKELVKKKKDEQQIHDQIMRRKLFAWQFSRPLVSQAIDQATATLQNKGVFYDPMLRNLVIWLSKGIYDGADNVICLRGLATELLDDLIFHGLRRQALFAQLPLNESEAMVRLLLRNPFVLRIPEDAPSGTEPLSVSVIGPIALSRSDSLEAIESRIEAWIVENVGSPVDIPKGGFLSLLQLAKTI
ncbi:Radial spoke protein 3 [Phytophthora infestans]|uniref:Radial spoke protein 3 n=1 Tax=Phytophthora infestans TaxID=4787 RepID=A0A833WPF4_PHYIN|nr:Radial spoke protein 3 [Phytophthora infestans]KAF4131458.1 Radial spoke protein 3 [Phytophthora infestans]